MLNKILYDTVVVSVAGGALSLDRTAAFQTMVSRPIVAAPVIGYLLGYPLIGLLCGAALELLFIGDLPVGTYIPVHETGMAVLVTAITVETYKLSWLNLYEVRGGGVMGAAFLLPAAVAVGIPVSRLYQSADRLTRGFNAKFLHEAQQALSQGGDVNLTAENLKGAACFFVTMSVALFITVLPFLLVVSFAAPHLRYMPRPFFPAFAALTAVGAASAYHAVETEKSLVIFLASCVIGASLYFVVS